MKLTLGAKLFLSYVLVLLVGLLVLVAVAQASLPRAYGRHMGPVMRPLVERAPRLVMHVEFANFRAGFYEALAWAGLVALIVALGVSYWLSRRLTAPLEAVCRASQSIAEGHYAERVAIPRDEELAQLATSFNKMAEKLEHTEAMRRRLIGDVAHELRTPLTAIKGSMEGLVDGILPATPETFEQIAAEADRLSRLVDDLQELSRVEAGAFVLDLQPVSLAQVIETARKRLSASYAAKGVELTLDVSADLPTVRADTDRLLQILLNLLTNALQYTPSGGRVTVSAEARPKEIWVRVQDTGIGIPPEHLSRIFDRFYRVDKSRSRQSGGGSGIGLTICKHLVEAHGGRIWAESAGEGQGSTFIFTLPLA